MKELVQQYSTLLDQLYNQRNEYREEELAVFAPVKGTHYNNELMVVGRAVNSWNKAMDKNKKSDIAKLNKFVQNELSNANLNWVEEWWLGKPGKDYKTSSSAFWRVIKAMATNINGDQKDIFNTIVWSNLYKVSNWDGGNPTSKLMNLQFDYCLEILKLELEIFKPKRVVFLTSYDWANEFLTPIGVNQIKTRKKFEFVDYIGEYNGIKMVVSQHPQGKPEEPHVNEILKAFSV